MSFLFKKLGCISIFRNAKEEQREYALFAVSGFLSLLFSSLLSFCFINSVKRLYHDRTRKQTEYSLKEFFPAIRKLLIHFGFNSFHRVILLIICSKQ